MTRRVAGSLATVVMLTGLVSCRWHTKPPPAAPLTASKEMVDSLWNAALNLYARHKWENAGVAFDRAELEMPIGDHRILIGRLYLGDIYMHQGSNLEAVREYRRLSDDFPSDSLAAVALLHAADAYLKLWRRIELDPTYAFTAQTTYQELIGRYPGTPEAKIASDRLNDINNRLAEKQYRAGLYYLKFKAFDSAVLYFKDLVATWPYSDIAPDALTGLIQAYRKLGYVEDVQSTCDYFRRQFPKAPKLDATCPANGQATLKPVKPKGP